VYSWLSNPVKLAWTGIGERRYRLAFMPLHRSPEYELLVRVDHGR
jgi:hypothetical protein